jgi:hypothetical protein
MALPKRTPLAVVTLSGVGVGPPVVNNPIKPGEVGT